MYLSCNFAATCVYVFLMFDVNLVVGQNTAEGRVVISNSGASPIDINGGDSSPSLFSKTNMLNSR